MNRSRRLHPIKAYRAWTRLWANPDDTVAVFEILEALRGGSEERVFKRFRATPTGSAVLTEQRDLIATLSDREHLRRYPEGSLGACYAAFMDAEKISADGLAAASELGAETLDDAELLRFVSRWRDMHDLHHVITGYGRDLHGEAALLAFSVAQTPTLGLGFIVTMAYLNGDSEDRRLIRRGFRRGRAARWFVDADWENLLARPLEEVRSALGAGHPEPYAPLWSGEAPAATS